MKHRVYGKHLGRDKDERTALFKSLVRSLFLHGSIDTSVTKAKAIKGLVDKIINLAKDKQRSYMLPSYLVDKDVAKRLTDDIIPKVASRTSGYTSVLRLGKRYGDNTMMVRMSIIGVEKLKQVEKVSTKKTQVIEKKEISEKKSSTRQSVRKTTLTKKRSSRLSKGKK